MKDFREFVITPETCNREQEQRTPLEQQTIDYFNALKKVIDEAHVTYLPGDHVFSISDSSWEDMKSWGNLSKNDHYLQKAYPLKPDRTVIWRTVSPNNTFPLNILSDREIGLPDISILKELMEKEGLRLEVLDWRTSNAVVAEVYVAE